MSKKIAVLTLVIILALVNWFIYGKEKHLSEGKTVYLELAPVDPRSLMQGDYMDLRFELADKLYKALPKAEENQGWRHTVTTDDGFVVVGMDEDSIGSFQALYKDQSLSENEILMRYRVRHGRIRFATNAYFFQEGHGESYERAQYGRFCVDESGELLLTGLYDENLNKVEPTEDGSKIHAH